MNIIKNDYILYALYKNFLKKYRPYYNIFFLADLIHWMRDDQALFSAEQIRNKWKEHLILVKDKKISNAFNFYIHIPFCKSRCSYCMYYSKKMVKKELKSYINRLIKQINFFKKIFNRTEFSSLYFGGGTPSILSREQLNKFLNVLFDSFNFKKDGEKTFESNLKSITLEKIKLLNKFGFNRISFGVQNLDKKVLSFNNREYQNLDVINKIVENAKKLGLEVNADLMMGIKGDSVKSIVGSFKELARIKPDTVTLYAFKPPEKYLEKYFNNDYYSFNNGLYKKVEKVRQTLKEMKDKLGFYVLEKGFEIYSTDDPTYFSKNFKEPYNYHYDSNIPLSYPSPCSLFALGTRASSYIFNSLQYHDAAIGKEDIDFNPKEKNFWSIGFSPKEEMRYFILQQLSNRLCFSQKDFKEFFDSDFKKNFKTEINSLRKLGKIKFVGDLVFLPADPLERFTSALFFLDKRRVVNKINNFFQGIHII